MRRELTDLEHKAIALVMGDFDFNAVQCMAESCPGEKRGWVGIDERDNMINCAYRLLKSLYEEDLYSTSGGGFTGTRCEVTNRGEELLLEFVSEWGVTWLDRNE